MGTPLFAPWTNTAVKLAAAALATAFASCLGGLMIYVRTPYVTDQLAEIDQPIEFDHRHHVADCEIDCLYCHREAETAPTAGLPATEICMGCHGQVGPESPLLAPVRASYFEGRPIRWNRVHDLPDFVFFDHAAHLHAGGACAECHGQVERMARVLQVAPLTMGWCLDCHRNPDRYRTEESRLPRTTWGATVENLTADWPRDRAITQLTTCTACHR